MTYQPIVPLPGIAGWNFLQNTYDTQFEAFTSSPQIHRETEYFSENISGITSAEDLIADRRLLSVALGAFGLSEDVDNRAFIQRILEDGTEARDALANRLADDRYAAFSDAFGFGPNQLPQTVFPGFADRIVGLYEAQEFEAAVGTEDESMRIALYAQRELANIAGDGGSQDAQWFRIMGQPPLRQMMETALGLPESFGQIDIDRQNSELQDRARQQFGSDQLQELVKPDRLSQITTAYLARAQINSLGASATSGSIALSLLQASQR